MSRFALVSSLVSLIPSILLLLLILHYALAHAPLGRAPSPLRVVERDDGEARAHVVRDAVGGVDEERKVADAPAARASADGGSSAFVGTKVGPSALPPLPRGSAGGAGCPRRVPEMSGLRAQRAAALRG